MDEMKIKSQFVTGILSKLIGDKIRKKTNCDVNVNLHEVEATVSDGRVHAHVDVDLDAEEALISKMLH